MKHVRQEGGLNQLREFLHADSSEYGWGIAQKKEDILAEVFMPRCIFIVTDFVDHSSFDGVLMDVAEQGDEV